MKELVLSRYKLIIFDMDGTIFDTERLGVEGWKKAFNNSRYDIPVDEVLEKKIGLNSADSKALMEQYFGKKFDYTFLKNEKRKFVKEYIEQNGTPVKTGLFELLDIIDSLEIQKAIATSRRAEMGNYYLEKAGIEKRFDLIVTGDMVSHGKPNPEIFIITAERLNVSPSECLVIEDSLNGIKAGKDAGMETIMIPDLVFPREEDSPFIDFLFGSLKEIASLSSRE